VKYMNTKYDRMCCAQHGDVISIDGGDGPVCGVCNGNYDAIDEYKTKSMISMIDGLKQNTINTADALNNLLNALNNLSNVIDSFMRSYISVKRSFEKIKSEELLIDKGKNCDSKIK